MADSITRIDPSVLKVHPRNAEFFDDVSGAEFDRLVESIKDHGVLTPLRVTKDMTIISGHQRVRAAIQAGCKDVPVIVDEDDNEDDVLMKLIETNFGRMKNDPIKQAKWVEEYEKLRGVRQGSWGKRSLDPNNLGLKKSSQLSQDDVAKELGVTTETLRNLKSLLKLDPALQALISDGKINATTGFKILSKLTPEEQQSLIDRLPDDVKLSAKSIQAYIDEMREEFSDNTSKAMQERDKLLGEKERLIRENNELKAGNLPVSEAAQNKIAKLEEEKRKYYEDLRKAEDGKETLRTMLKEYSDENEKLKAIVNGSGDDAVIALQGEIDTLKDKLAAQERKKNDLEYQLSEKEDEINDLKLEKKNGFMRKALHINETPEELTQRQRDALVSSIQIAIGQFQSSMESALTQVDSFGYINKEILKVLVETCSQAINAGTRLKVALLSSCGFDNGENDDTESSSGGSGYEYDPDYDFDDNDLDLDLNLGA